jgi:hypothetical protein
MNKRELVNELQSNLMKLAQAFVDNKPQTKPWGAEKEEFSYLNEKFTKLIGNLTAEFYLEETDDKYLGKVLELNDEIKSKIEIVKSSKKQSK